MSIVLRGLTKTFNNFVALDQVSLTIEPGEIHALLGANGSGKSTLVSLVTGALAPDSGKIIIDELDVTENWSTGKARKLGISVVYQEAPLLDRLPISESVALFSKYPRRTLGTINWRKLNSSTQEILSSLAINRSSRDLTLELTGAERALLALEIAVRTAPPNLQLLILDEATASLAHIDAEPFLKRVQEIASRGIGILLVTHRLPELTVADYVTILHEGKIAVQTAARSLTHKDVVDVMTSSTKEFPKDEHSSNSTIAKLHLTDLWSEKEEGTVQNEEEVLRVENLRGTEVKNVSITIKKGEIVGFIGPRGGGLDELPKLLSGAEPYKSGEIYVCGQKVTGSWSPATAFKYGIAYLPADRLREGGIRTFDLQDNLVLTTFREFWHKSRKKREFAKRVIDYLLVRPKTYQTLFGNLSGGNQQKIILARLLRLKPKILVLADPTYGVDPAARVIIFNTVREARVLGLSVILTTTEPEQMLNLCDRVLVISSGVCTEEFKDLELTLELLITKGI